MHNEKTYTTKYGTFYDKLNEADIKFYEMTDEEFDARANRLAWKCLNGIRDDEMIEADARAIRNIELRYGKQRALEYTKELEIFN